jgi:hypothetical protein
MEKTYKKEAKRSSKLSPMPGIDNFSVDSQANQKL